MLSLTVSMVRSANPCNLSGRMTMDAIFDYMERYDYENLLFCQDKALDFKAVIAIHDTTLGPATGRMPHVESVCRRDGSR